MGGGDFAVLSSKMNAVSSETVGRAPDGLQPSGGAAPTEANKVNSPYQAEAASSGDLVPPGTPAGQLLPQYATNSD